MIFCTPKQQISNTFSLQTVLNTTETTVTPKPVTPKPPPPPLSKVTKQGEADGLQRELDKLTANEDLIRTSITVLQNTMHSLTAATNKLNLDMVTQKHKFDSFMFNVSFDLRI